MHKHRCNTPSRVVDMSVRHVHRRSVLNFVEQGRLIIKAAEQEAARAKRKRTCMTNREWALSSRRGNEATRDFVGDNQAGFQPGTGGLSN